MILEKKEQTNCGGFGLKNNKLIIAIVAHLREVAS